MIKFDGYDYELTIVGSNFSEIIEAQEYFINEYGLKINKFEIIGE